jgi:hypothetical protein
MRHASFTLGELALVAHQTIAARGASKTCIDVASLTKPKEHKDPSV